jgi:hypothetical protein
MAVVLVRQLENEVVGEIGAHPGHDQLGRPCFVDQRARGDSCRRGAGS